MQTSFEKEYVEEDKQLELPPGFRFYPSDEELVSHYLTPKVFDPSFSCLAIGEADLNKCEPWDLPWRAKMGEKEWYFFSLKDRKYPTGFRTNRATESGYWKATGKDKEIYKMKTLVGMKKTLVFYTGRAPKGLKTNWVIHEFRLDGKFAAENVPKSGENEWVISRVFEKCSGGKKIHITNKGQNGHSISQHHLPPLMDSSPTFTSSQSKTEHNCFSNPSVIQPQNTAKHELLAPPPPLFSSAEAQFVQNFGSPRQDQDDIVRNMVETCRWNNNSQNQTQTQTQTQNGFLHFSSGGMIQQDVDQSSAAAGYNSSGLDLIWSYFMQ